MPANKLKWPQNDDDIPRRFAMYNFDRQVGNDRYFSPMRSVLGDYRALVEDYNNGSPKAKEFMEAFTLYLLLK